MATQTEHPWRATLRTVVSVVLSLAAAAPIIFTAITDQSPELATGAFATALAVSAAITRLMALPVVNDLLSRIGLGATPRHEVDWHGPSMANYATNDDAVKTED